MVTVKRPAVLWGGPLDGTELAIAYQYLWFPGSPPVVYRRSNQISKRRWVYRFTEERTMSVLPENYPPTRTDQKAMIENPERWPLRLYLPLRQRKVGRPTQFGFLIADNPLKVVLGFIPHLAGSDIQTLLNLDTITYASIDKLLDDDWKVD